MTVFVIIPVHNRILSTLRCLESLKKQTYPHLRVIVVDDGSTDNTFESLFNFYGNSIEILRADGTLFWTGAVSLGVSHVLKGGILDNDFILLVNNDVIFRDLDTVSKMVNFSSELKHKSLVSALTLDLHDPQKIVVTGTVVKSWLLNWTYHFYDGLALDDLDESRVLNCDFLTARCLLHPISVFKDIGNYDWCNFPHYGGDDEFVYRAKRFGYQILVNPNIRVELDVRKVHTPKNKMFLSTICFYLFSKKSSINIRDRFMFSLKIAPRYAFLTNLLFGILKSIVKSFQLFFSRAQ